MSRPLIPGEISGPDGTIELNAGLPCTSLDVVNGGDRPVQVGSHYHFAEANPALLFDRTVALGQRLDIPAGTSVRFEPGIARTVSLVPIGGDRIVAGMRGEVAGDCPIRPAQLTRCRPRRGCRAPSHRWRPRGNSPRPKMSRQDEPYGL